VISIHEYKANPCKLSSVPYWKLKSFKIPSNIVVVHDQDYCPEAGVYDDTRYFRLIHDLQRVEQANLGENFAFRYVNTSSIDDLEAATRIINSCYSDIQVSLDQVREWTRSAVFCSELWITIIDVSKDESVALGIAELDREVGEGALEWIQVLPQYQGRKLGQALVNKLLGNLQGKAEFVTVSGKVDNETKPEKLYRRCGFTGNDIWHVLQKK